MRRQFKLPEIDEDYLDGLGLSWELIKDKGLNWLIVHGYAVPPGYTVETTSVALMIPASYPDVEIDMAYFRPELKRSDRGTIRAITNQTIKRKTWQRWSRHRTRTNPWRPGVDDVQSHLQLVDEWLAREIPNLIPTTDADVQLKEVMKTGIDPEKSKIIVKPKPRIRLKRSED